MLASSYPRYSGDSAGTFVQSLALGLERLGHQVHVVAPWDPAAAAAIGMLTRFHYSPWRRLQPMGYGKALQNDQRLRGGAVLCAVPYFIAATFHLARAVIRENCDLVEAHWVLPNGPPAAVATTACRPVMRPGRS